MIKLISFFFCSLLFFPLVDEQISKKIAEQELKQLSGNLNSGPVAAGVVGKEKFVIDVWGDAINVAAHMEANLEDDKINISETTHQLVSGKFNFQERGAIKMKNMKEMNMYFVCKNA